MAAYQPSGEPQAPAVQYQAYYSQPASSPSKLDTGPSNPTDGTAVDLPVAGGDYSQEQPASSLPPTTGSEAAQAAPLPPAQGVLPLTESFPAVSQHPSAQTEQIAPQPNPNQVSVNGVQIQQPTTVFQAQAQPPAQMQAPQVAGAVYSTPDSVEVPVQYAAPNQYTYVGQLPTAEQVQGFPPPVLPLGQQTTLVQTQATAYGSPQANNLAYQYVQTAPGQVTYMQTSDQLQYVPAPSTGPVISQAEIPYFSAPPPIGPRTPKIFTKETWNKEAAKSASKTAWKHSKNFLVKTNDVVEKVITPIMPLLTFIDPEVAAGFRAQQQLTRVIRAQGGRGRGRGQAVQQRPNSMAANQQLVAQLSAQLQQQQKAGGVDNITPILTLLQASAQAGAVPGQQAGSGLEAALILALVQQQAQQQQQQQQGQAPQQQQPGQVPPPPPPPQQQQQQQQQIPLRKQPNRKPVPSATANTTVAQNPASPPQTQPDTAPGPSVAAQQESSPAPTLESVLAALVLQVQTSESQPEQPQQGNPTSQPPTTTTTAPTPQEPATANWQHHRARVFGIQDMLLPPQHNLSAASRTMLAGDIAGGAGHFSIELLYNPIQLQRCVDALQKSLAASAVNPRPDDPSTPLTAPPDLNAGAAMAADCVVFVDGTASYVAVLQSPSQQGHGLCVTASATAVATLPLARVIGETMVRSICWGDFALVCRDVSASLVGMWRWKEEESKESVFDFNAGCRFVYDGPPVTTDGTATGDEAGEPQRSTGSFQVFEYENGVCHLVMTDDDPGQSADVRVLERGEGSLVIEGRKYLAFSKPAEME